jgi:hypothetical protein
VSWIKDRQKWKAQLQVDGKNRHLGCFFDEEEAARKYDEIALSFGRPSNFPAISSSSFSTSTPSQAVVDVEALEVGGTTAKRIKMEDVGNGNEGADNVAMVGCVTPPVAASRNTTVLGPIDKPRATKAHAAAFCASTCYVCETNSNDGESILLCDGHSKDGAECNREAHFW